MINILKIKPMGSQIVTTADIYTEEQFIAGTNIIDSSKTKQGLKEYQRVVAVGQYIREIKPGDLVCINPEAYANRKYQKGSMKENMEEYDNCVVSYNFNMVKLNNVDHLILTDRDIDFVLEEYEELPDKPILQNIDKKIEL